MFKAGRKLEEQNGKDNQAKVQYQEGYQTIQESIGTKSPKAKTKAKKEG